VTRSFDGHLFPTDDCRPARLLSASAGPWRQGIDTTARRSPCQGERHGRGSRRTDQVQGCRIRLFGIDAERASSALMGGQQLSLWPEGRICSRGQSVVTCEPRDADRYGRTVAICRVFGEDLGA
jgi:endonuclease YncB( thermonuclease family)